MGCIIVSFIKGLKVRVVKDARKRNHVNSTSRTTKYRIKLLSVIDRYLITNVNILTS